MHLLLVQRLIGVLLMLFSGTMLPPALVGVLFGGEGDMVVTFLSAFGLILFSGALIWLPARKAKGELRTRDGFLVVVLFWSVLGLFGATPLYLSELPELSLTDAVFESLSGLTTTGATVITGLDSLPKSILFYRQQLQWLGGMGIIVLAVAVLPMLGVGGMQLYRAETPGPMKDSKLTPRITETAKALWYLYLGITVSCATAYWAAGMTPFDAIGHAFSTVAIGGFSTHDASMGYFDNPTIDLIAIVFMLLAAVNFALHFGAWRASDPRYYFRDPEVLGFLKVMFALMAFFSISLYWLDEYTDPQQAGIKAVFQVVSMGTTTGFTTADYTAWPGILPVVLILSSFIGGCAGSTAGGIKVIRVQLLRRQIKREIMKLIHPAAKFPIKLGERVVTPRIMESVWGFVAAYLVVYLVVLLLLISTGMDQITAFSAVAASLNNLGPGLGEIASNCASINDAAKWIMVVAMLLGRLELFSLLVILTPAFWRR